MQLLVFCLLAFGYALPAVPSTLFPVHDLLNANGGPAGNGFLAFYAELVC